MVCLRPNYTSALEAALTLGPQTEVASTTLVTLETTPVEPAETEVKYDVTTGAPPLTVEVGTVPGDDETGIEVKLDAIARGCTVEVVTWPGEDETGMEVNEDEMTSSAFTVEVVTAPGEVEAGMEVKLEEIAR